MLLETILKSIKNVILITTVVAFWSCFIAFILAIK